MKLIPPILLFIATVFICTNLGKYYWGKIESVLPKEEEYWDNNMTVYAEPVEGLNLMRMTIYNEDGGIVGRHYLDIEGNVASIEDFSSTDTLETTGEAVATDHELVESIDSLLEYLRIYYEDGKWKNEYIEQ